MMLIKHIEPSKCQSQLYTALCKQQKYTRLRGDADQLQLTALISLHCIRNSACSASVQDSDLNKYLLALYEPGALGFVLVVDWTISEVSRGFRQPGRPQNC